MAYDSRNAISGQMMLDDIKDPPLLTKGHYYATVQRFEIRENVEMTDRNGRRTEVTVVDFVAGNFEPAADVDPSRLADIDLSSYELAKTFWYTPAGMPELRDFIRSFKFGRNGPTESFYHETVGRKVLCTITPGTFKSKRTGKDIPTVRLDEMVATELEPTTDLSAAQ